MDSEDDDVYSYLGKHLYKSSIIYIKRGDYAPLLKRVNENLLKAKVILFFLMKNIYWILRF